MRRRRPIDVWPAFADLMTVLAVVGLVAAAGAWAYRAQVAEWSVPEQSEAGPEAETRNEDELARLTRELQEAQSQLELLRALAAGQGANGDLLADGWDAGLDARLRAAMARVQGFIDRVTEDRTLRFDRDQSLRLGDDLVQFERNEVDPIWRPDGVDQLRRFCRRLAEELRSLEADYPDPARLFLIHVEGHTDASRCPGGDEDCNWYFSSLRAVSFLDLMRDEERCPGGSAWRLRPIGYGATRPLAPTPGGPPGPVRRISLRLVPDYDQWIGRGAGTRLVEP